MSIASRFIAGMRDPLDIFEDDAEAADFEIVSAVTRSIQARLGYAPGEYHPPSVVRVLERASADAHHIGDALPAGDGLTLLPADYKYSMVARIVAKSIQRVTA